MGKKTIHELIKWKKNPILMVTGRQDKGKTHFVKVLIKGIHKNYDKIIIMTGTEFDNDLILPYSNLSSLVISEANIKKIIEACTEMKKSGDPDLKNYRMLLVMDDFMGKIKLNSATFKDLAGNSRHYGITLILLSQIFNDNLPVCLRENSSYMVFFSGLNELNMKGVKNFINSYRRYEDFYTDYVDTLKKNYSFCFVNRNYGDGEKEIIFFDRIEKDGRSSELETRRKEDSTERLREYISGFRRTALPERRDEIRRYEPAPKPLNLSEILGRDVRLRSGGKPKKVLVKNPSSAIKNVQEAPRCSGKVEIKKVTGWGEREAKTIKSTGNFFNEAEAERFGPFKII